MLKLQTPYTHKHSSNILGTDSITSSSGYDIQLPVLLYREKLNFPERLVKVAASQNSFPVSNRINGLEMISGLLEVTSKEDDYYNCNIGQGAYEFSSVIKDKTLKDLDLGGERTFVKQSHYNYPEEEFTLFEVGNVEFWTDEDVKEKYIEDFGGVQNLFINNLPYSKTESLIQYNWSPYVVTPFPFVGYLLKQIFKFARINITRNDWDSSPMLARKVMYLNESICKKTWTPPSEYNMFGSTERGVDKWSMNDIIPEVLISDFLIWIQNNLNISFNFKRNREVEIIDREAIFSKPASRFFLDKIIPESTEPDFDKEHNGVSFIQEFDTSDGNFNNTLWNDISDVDADLIDESVELYADLPTAGIMNHVIYCKETNAWYIWKEYVLTDEDGDETNYTSWRWEWYSFNIQILNLGEADYLEISSGFSPTNFRPSIAGNEAGIQENNEMTPRLYNHFGNESGSHSWGKKDADTRYESVGDAFNGEDGLLNKRWANTARFFLKRTSCTCTANLTPQQLRDLDDTIPYLHPDGYTFLIDEVTASVSEGDEILECEIDFWAY